MRVSVITINRNNLAGLKKTVESVMRQTLQELEYILIDGDSDDGSKEYSLSLRTKNIRALSEKDNGIYSAMNKGLAQATGDYIVFMNSGDCFATETTLEDISREVNESGTAPDYIYGDTLLEDGRVWSAKPACEIWKGMICSHQSILIRTDLVVRYGFDETLSIVADYKLIYQVVRHHSGKRINRAISRIEPVGSSSDFLGRTCERWHVLRRLAPKNRIREIDDFYSRLIAEFRHEMPLKDTLVKSKQRRGSDSHHDQASFVFMSNSRAQEQVVFLISMPRSGSTLLQRCIGQHSKVTTTGETWALLPYLTWQDRQISTCTYDNEIAAAAQHEFSKWLSEDKVFIEAERELACSIYSKALQMNPDSKYFLDKTPRYIYAAKRIMEVMPDSKFIILSRDPAAIITSYAYTWARPIGSYRWIKSKDALINDICHGFSYLCDFVDHSRGKANVLIVDYAELIREPRDALMRITDFLGIEFEAGMMVLGSSPTQSWKFGDPENAHSKRNFDVKSLDWISKNSGNSEIGYLHTYLSMVDERAFKLSGTTKEKSLEKVCKAYSSQSLLHIPGIDQSSRERNANARLEQKTEQSISVVVTSFNNSLTIEQCLDSILAQTLLPGKIVVADDCSCDDTKNKVLQYISSRNLHGVEIETLFRRRNVGISINRDYALRSVRSPLVTTLDADDVFSPDKIEREFRLLTEGSTLVAFSNTCVIQAPSSVYDLDSSGLDSLNRIELFTALITRSIAVPRDMMMRLSYYKLVGGYDPLFNIYEDWHLKMKLAASLPSGFKWKSTGSRGTVYDRRSPGLSGLDSIALVIAELRVICHIGSNVSRYSLIPSCRVGIKRLINKLAGEASAPSASALASRLERMVDRDDILLAELLPALSNQLSGSELLPDHVITIIDQVISNF